jgi:phosphoribosylaminoimidazole-succinocarboxamide synthase
MSHKHLGSGKVRELYEAGGDLLLVASDRISAYDVVLPTQIEDKGRVLTALSHHFFDVTAHLCPNHLLSVGAEDLPDIGVPDLPGRAMLCRRADPFPVEFVVRGYLSGSGWRDYQRSGEICGHRLPDGLVESDRLPRPLLTPTTKATTGHDAPLTESEAASLCAPGAYEIARDYSLAIYDLAAREARDHGVIIADTKFEFGRIGDEIVLIDEVLTPDSSRFWPADDYRAGGPQPSFDKQYVRDWLDAAGWDHSPPAPELPAEIAHATRSRYLEAYERITGRPFDIWMKEVVA